VRDAAPRQSTGWRNDEACAAIVTRKLFHAAVLSNCPGLETSELIAVKSLIGLSAGSVLCAGVRVGMRHG
jgi:hypothetical protein